MVTLDAKSTSGPLSGYPEIDSPEQEPLPPAYDAYGPSSSHGAASSTAITSHVRQPSSNAAPAHLAHLFSGPPNQEPLLPRGSASLERVSNIKTVTREGEIHSSDAELADRMLCSSASSLA